MNDCLVSTVLLMKENGICQPDETNTVLLNRVKKHDFGIMVNFILGFLFFYLGRKKRFF